MTRGGRKQRKRERRQRENDRTEAVISTTDDHNQNVSISSIFRSEDLQEITNLLAVNQLENSHALLGAIALGRFDVLKKLLKSGHSLELTKEAGLSPILWAVKLKQLDVTDFLLRRGANINATDPEENNALLLALQTQAWNQDNFLDFWNLIKDTNINLNHFNKTGSAALHYLVKRQWNACLEVILSNSKVNINILTKKGVSAMMMACSRHQEETFSILLKYNADIFTEDERGCTALCYAVAYFMQKSLTLPNTIIDGLLNIYMFSRSSVGLESYLQRRLDLIINPPQENFNHTISTILSPIISFFNYHILNGLDLLVALNFFRKIKLAIEKNMENSDYCLCLFDIVADVITSQGKIQNKTDQNGLVKSFTESNMLQLILKFIKRNGTETLENKDLFTIIRPLFYLSHHHTIQCWLQRNFKALASSFNLILSSSPQLTHKDDLNFQAIDQGNNDFNSLIGRLSHGEATNRDEKSSKKRRYDLRSRSVGKDDWSNSKKKQEMIMRKGIILTRKSEENLRTLKADDICAGDSNTGTYWVTNHQDVFIEGGEEDRLNYPKWQENFKEGCALFGISPNVTEDSPIETIWGLEVGNGDSHSIQNHSITDDDQLNSTDKKEEPQTSTTPTQSVEENDGCFESKLCLIDILVKRMVAYYEKSWAKDYLENFENSNVTKDDRQQLSKILPQLEKYHITKLRSSWALLSCRLHEKWGEDRKEAILMMDQLIKYLSGIVQQPEEQNNSETLSVNIINETIPINHSSSDEKLTNEKYQDIIRDYIDEEKSKEPQSDDVPLKTCITFHNNSSSSHYPNMDEVKKVFRNSGQFIITGFMLNSNIRNENGAFNVEHSEPLENGQQPCRKMNLFDDQIFYGANSFRKLPPPPGFSEINSFPFCDGE